MAQAASGEWEVVNGFLRSHFPVFDPEEIMVCPRCDRAFGVSTGHLACPNCGEPRIPLRQALDGDSEARAAFVRAYRKIQERLAALPE